MPLADPPDAPDEAVVAEVVSPDAAREGVNNLILLKTNSETSLLARLCIAIRDL